jgi:hypothetical protein
LEDLKDALQKTETTTSITYRTAGQAVASPRKSRSSYTQLEIYRAGELVQLRDVEQQLMSDAGHMHDSYQIAALGIGDVREFHEGGTHGSARKGKRSEGKSKMEHISG